MIDELLRRIAAFHRSRTPCPEYPMVAEVLDGLDTVAAPAAIARQPRLGVVDHLDAISSSGCDDELDAVLEEFLRIGRHLPWRRTAGYLDALSADYLDNYGYVQLAGPSPSIAEHPSIRVGIGVWGPNLDYPLHHHEAEELYHVLAGDVSFGDADGSWYPAAVGDAIHNPPWHQHAQRFGPTPTVLLYCWTGAVEADAVLIDTTTR